MGVAGVGLPAAPVWRRLRDDSVTLAGPRDQEPRSAGSPASSSQCFSLSGQATRCSSCRSDWYCKCKQDGTRHIQSQSQTQGDMHVGGKGDE